MEWPTFLSKWSATHSWFVFFGGIFTLLQAYQSTLFGWDLLVYHFQGKWFCGEQIYFEFLRPPLPGVMNCLVGAGEHSIVFSTLIACLLYLWGVWRLYHHESPSKRDPLVFFGLAFVFPTILIHSNAGGDLFALAFLLLALTSKNNFIRGIAFGLATLSRYSYAFFLPVLLYPKGRGPFLLGAILTWIPWVAYNYFSTGNPFFSVEETILLNVQQRGILVGLEWGFLAVMVFYILPLSFAHFKKWVQHPLSQIGIINIIVFLVSGIKESRFLLPLVPGNAAQYEKISSTQKHARPILIGIIFLSLVVGPWYMVNFHYGLPPTPTDARVHSCNVLSDEWIYFYPSGIIAQPTPLAGDFPAKLDEGNIIVIYNQNIADFPSDYPVERIKTNRYEMFIPTKCKEPLHSFVLYVWRG